MSIARINDLISSRQSFVFETTMTSRHSIRAIERARQAGFRVGLIFVLLDSVELHIARVAARVAQGGHFVPEKDIRRRYVTAQRNLCHVLDLIDEGYVIDNSPAGSPRRLVAISGGKASRLEDFNPRSSFDLEFWQKLCDHEPSW